MILDSCVENFSSGCFCSFCAPPAAPVSAHHLFDGMPEGFDETTAAGSEDRIGALPDELHQHLLSFLPSREVVRTWVLARPWRHQLKSVPALRITDVHTYESAQHLNNFVNYLIVLRDQSPLHECEIKSYDEEGGDERFRYTELWIQYALSHIGSSLMPGWGASTPYLRS